MAASASTEIVVRQSESSEYSFDDGVLKLRGKAVKVYYFDDDPATPWFHAKAIHRFIGAAKVMHTMTRVHGENKSSLKELVEKKGSPSAAGSSRVPALTLENLDYHDGKSYYVNEPGLYQIMFGSVKPAAKDFTNWVTGVVLPALRKSGAYSVKRQSSSVIELEHAAKRCPGRDSAGRFSERLSAEIFVSGPSAGAETDEADSSRQLTSP